MARRAGADGDIMLYRMNLSVDSLKVINVGAVFKFYMKKNFQ